ncbi:MAG: sodium-dependent transporter, partial [Candidatus Eisenbacteria bacterium]|nr:sodium-dependent transporter [Candidatus Eisenbacteria bacterium]
MADTPRDQWKSKLGFILAASGSAIGLGNIVFFAANAYKFGAGAFYVPYLVALFLLGIPVMIMELGIGHRTQRAYPEAMYQLGGIKGEWIGWFGLLNASVITMYYITILGWVLG